MGIGIVSIPTVEALTTDNGEGLNINYTVKVILLAC